MAEVAATLAPSGATVVDAGIIGGPPKPGYTPQVYVSGPAAGMIAVIGDALDLRPLEGPVGAASAMKMCYAGLSKGFQALGAAMLGAAVKAGAGEALLAQLGESQPDFLRYLRTQVPGAFPKAYRFVGEMEEISAFLKAGGDMGGSQIYAGMAQLYERLARDVDGGKTETGALLQLLK
jgi:putative dehydrogenase